MMLTYSLVLVQLLANVIKGVVAALAPILSPITLFVAETVTAAGGASSDTLSALQTATSSLQSIITSLGQSTL